VEGNDPHGGHGRVCEGDRARVGVSHGMVEVKILCFRWLFPFLKLCRRGFQDLLVWSSSLFVDIVWVHFKFIIFFKFVYPRCVTDTL
jgi:hypothetical protein